MQQKLLRKVRLVLHLGIAMLFITVAFSNAVVKSSDTQVIQTKKESNPLPSKTPTSPILKFLIHDWNWWSNKPNMFALPTGNVGIGTSAPLSKLHVENGAVLFNGSIGETPISGPGIRFMWIPSKMAFRAGIVNGDEWDDENIGVFSSAMGSNTVASGWGATAFGVGTKAIGQVYSTAMGCNTNASGDYSTALGGGTTASGHGATAMGIDSLAAGFCSTAMGFLTAARGNFTTAMGQRITVNGENSVGIGLNSQSPAYKVNQSHVLSIMGGNVGIGTTQPTAKLDVRGNISNDGFPVCAFVGQVYQQGNLSGTYSTWIDVPGISIDFSLTTSKQIDIRATGSGYFNGPVYLRFVVDGTPYGHPDHGDCAVGGTYMVTSWYVERVIPLSSGSHDVRLQLQTPDGASISMWDYEDSARMFVFAW